MEMRNISIIGPSCPFKGGISHYNSLLANELSKSHKVKLFSFKVQYPKFIYPANQQKDFKGEVFRFRQTEYLINSVNPFTWVKTAFRIARFSPDLLIFPWWNPFFGPCFSTIATLSKFLCKTKILFINHNIFPHERLPFDRFIASATLKRGDFHIVHSRENEKQLLDIIDNPVYRKTCHPTYGVFNKKDISKEKARQGLGLKSDDNVILFFGFVRRYKGLKYLIESLQAIRQRIPNLKLLVVGDFYDDKDKYLKKMEKLDVKDIVDIYDNYVPDEEVGTYFTASDLVVLPYTSATQSGIVQIAYGFSKPVVVTSVGGLPEVVEDGKTGYVVPPMDSASLADAVSRFFEMHKETEFLEYIEREQEKYSWNRLVEVIEELTGIKSSR